MSARNVEEEIAYQGPDDRPSLMPYQRMSVLDWTYDIVSALLCICDMCTDYYVTYQFLVTDHTNFFWCSVGILCTSQLVYTLTFLITLGDGLDPCLQFVFFICLLPLSPFLSVIMWLSWIGVCKFGLQGKVRDKQSLASWLIDKSEAHLGFVIEAFWEALCMSILQMIFILIDGNPSYINVISFVLSMLSVCAKSITFSYAVDKYVFLFNWLCTFIDAFSIYSICAWVFFDQNPFFVFNGARESSTLFENVQALAILNTFWIFKVFCVTLPTAINIVFYFLFGSVISDQLREWHQRCQEVCGGIVAGSVFFPFLLLFLICALVVVCFVTTFMMELFTFSYFVWFGYGINQRLQDKHDLLVELIPWLLKSLDIANFHNVTENLEAGLKRVETFGNQIGTGITASFDTVGEHLASIPPINIQLPNQFQNHERINTMINESEEDDDNDDNEDIDDSNNSGIEIQVAQETKEKTKENNNVNGTNEKSDRSGNKNKKNKTQRNDKKVKEEQTKIEKIKSKTNTKHSEIVEDEIDISIEDENDRNEKVQDEHQEEKAQVMVDKMVDNNSGKDVINMNKNEKGNTKLQIPKRQYHNKHSNSKRKNSNSRNNKNDKRRSRNTSSRNNRGLHRNRKNSKNSSGNINNSIKTTKAPPLQTSRDFEFRIYLSNYLMISPNNANTDWNEREEIRDLKQLLQQFFQDYNGGVIYLLNNSKDNRTSKESLSGPPLKRIISSSENVGGIDVDISENIANMIELNERRVNENSEILKYKNEWFKMDELEYKQLHSIRSKLNITNKSSFNRMRLEAESAIYWGLSHLVGNGCFPIRKPATHENYDATLDDEQQVRAWRFIGRKCLLPLYAVTRVFTAIYPICAMFIFAFNKSFEIFDWGAFEQFQLVLTIMYSTFLVIVVLLIPRVTNYYFIILHLPMSHSNSNVNSNCTMDAIRLNYAIICENALRRLILKQFFGDVSGIILSYLEPDVGLKRVLNNLINDTKAAKSYSMDLNNLNVIPHKQIWKNATNDDLMEKMSQIVIGVHPLPFSKHYTDYAS